MLLTQDQEMIRDAARDFAQAELWPNAAKWDKEHTFPNTAHHGLAALGAIGLTEPHGGSEVSGLRTTAVKEGDGFTAGKPQGVDWHPPARTDLSSMARALPAGVTVFERGWLSSNNILIQGKGGTALIDSGYCTHAEQTLALVDSVLQGRSLDLLLNTHLHSDHCGGNAALQARYPGLQTHIPPGHADNVRVWNADALSYTPTGQQCPRFCWSATLRPGTEMPLGDLQWQVHSAPGHDSHSVILFEPQSRTLVSADALWEKGFGVVFPELDGDDAFDEVAATLDVIERLNPATVIPGHGAPFTDAPQAIAYARQRLNGFVQNPAKHLQYAAKVLLKFKLLEARHLPLPTLIAWARNTSYLNHTFQKHFAGATLEEATRQLVLDLVRSGAAKLQDGVVFDA